ncbi:hypothetical protein PoB_005052500 [Plakobranchus ocellatus]|uniref:Uncharacterized protein n=1 Tax=Plakobranchus ocellatus TaxID=259542 RepID=A0AAV4BXH4_9GAST|nr:hypothetical protein PoB_005052500 [Plakobranchus ocellatus]
MSDGTVCRPLTRLPYEAPQVCTLKLCAMPGRICEASFKPLQIQNLGVSVERLRNEQTSRPQHGQHGQTLAPTPSP